VTKTPGDPDPAAAPESEVLEELGDDAIVAQQAAVHSPQPRAQIAVETRSVVIADQGTGNPSQLGPASADGVPTRQLLPYMASSAEPTLVIRDRKLLKALSATGPRAIRSGKASRMAKVAIWGGAGVLAFALGGLLALLTAHRAPTEPAVAEPEPIAAPAAPAPVIGAAEARAEGQPNSDQSSQEKQARPLPSARAPIQGKSRPKPRPQKSADPWGI